MLQINNNDAHSFFNAETKRMAVTAHVLLYDTKNSTSLLTLLDKNEFSRKDIVTTLDNKYVI